MDEQDKVNFRKMTHDIFQLYGKDEPDKKIVRMYYDSLKIYPIEEIRQALNRHIVDTDCGKWLPKPADIVTNITGNTQTQSELAWTKVDRTIRTIGPDDSVCFDDWIIHAVIEDMGGWIRMCGFTDKETPFQHNEFIKRYRGYSMRPQQQVMRRLIGKFEASNQSRGYMKHIPVPVLIGDKQSALLLLENGSDDQKQLFHRSYDVVESAIKKIENINNENR